jgi:hypothetical protein
LVPHKRRIRRWKWRGRWRERAGSTNPKGMAQDEEGTGEFVDGSGEGDGARAGSTNPKGMANSSMEVEREMARELAALIPREWRKTKRELAALITIRRWKWRGRWRT